MNEEILQFLEEQIPYIKILKEWFLKDKEEPTTQGLVKEVSSIE
jgi:hypothetical protein